MGYPDMASCISCARLLTSTYLSLPHALPDLWCTDRIAPILNYTPIWSFSCWAYTIHHSNMDSCLGASDPGSCVHTVLGLCLALALYNQWANPSSLEAPLLKDHYPIWWPYSQAYFNLGDFNLEFQNMEDIDHPLEGVNALFDFYII